MADRIINLENITAVPHLEENDLEDDEIQVKVKVVTTATFRVKRSDRVRNLIQFYGRAGISENLMDLCYDGEFLNNEQTFADYGIRNNSTVKLIMSTMSVLSRRLYIIAPAQPNLNLKIDANVNDSIHHIKFMLGGMLQRNPEQIGLRYEGTYLEEHETLASLNIENGSYLTLTEHPQDHRWISFLTPENGKISLEVKKTHTLGLAKIVIGSKIRKDVTDAALMFQGHRLDESKTFGYYNLVENATLELIFPFLVYVKLWKDGFISLDVFPSDDVTDINRKVAEKLGWDETYNNSISFNGIRLKPGYGIATYEIQKNDTLVMGRPMA